MTVRASFLVLSFALAAGIAAPAEAQSGENVLVVVNDATPQYADIAAKYVATRQVLAGNIVHLHTSDRDEIDRAHYEGEIERALADWLARNAAQDRILYI